MLKCEDRNQYDVSNKKDKEGLHGFFQTLLVNRHLNSDMWKSIVDLFVGLGSDSTVILAILVELCNRTNNERQIGNDLQREELEESN